MKVKLDPGAYPPEYAHETDGGMDIRAPHPQRIMPGGSAVFRTGVHVELPEGTAGLLVSKSGLNVKHDLLSTGLIDRGYTGEIVIKLYNHGSESYLVDRGDKISQLVVIPVRHEKIEIVQDLDDTERGENGFGSTGK